MSVTLSPVAGAAWQLFDNNGNLLVGGKLYTYAAGTTTPQTTYTTNVGNVAHTNPIILDSAGRVPGGEIWLTGIILYKFVLHDSLDNSIGTWDNISTINASNVGNTPAGNIAATDVQSALNELDTEKAALTGAAFTGAVSATTGTFSGAVSATTGTFSGRVTSTAGDMNLKAGTALSDAPAVLTGSQLVDGLFLITPTVARILTLDSVANILAAIPGSVTNSNFLFTIVNTAAFDVTLALSAGVTLYGKAVVNNGSSTWLIRRTSDTTLECWRLEGTTGVGVGQTWEDVTANRVSGVTYTNSTGKPIMVGISCNQTNGITVVIGGVTTFSAAAFIQHATFSFIVPVGVTYVVTASFAIAVWSELR